MKVGVEDSLGLSPSNLSSGGRCTIFPEHPEHCDVVIAVRKTFASISFVGCIFMIFVIWLFRKYVVFVQRLILYMTVAALFESISYMMSGLYEDGPTCNFMGWMVTFFDWTVLLWVCCITFNLFMNVIRTTTTERFEWAYHVVCWGLPLLISLLPLIGDHYGPAGAWCWINDEWKWRMGIWYMPLMIIIILLIIAYTYIIVVLKRKAETWERTYDPDTERNHRLLKEDIKPLRAYPFIYLVLSIFPLINRIQNAISPEVHVFALVLLASMSSPIKAAINAIAYGMDKETLSKLRPTQIKTAWMGRWHQQAVCREYAVSGGGDADPPHDSKFENVSYSRLH